MDLNKEMDQLEKMMETVRTKYLMFFSGRDHIEPLQYRWQLDAFVRRLQKETFANRMQANRFRSILQKLGNYQSLWNRLRREKVRAQGRMVDKEIEEALKKEMAEAGLGEVEQSESRPECMEEMVAETSVHGTRGSIPAAPEKDMEQAVPEIPKPAPAPESSPASRQEEFKELFDGFLNTRRMTGEPTQALSFEGFQKRLNGQLELLQKKYPGKEFSFKVVLKDGKASIKAEPK